MIKFGGGQMNTKKFSKRFIIVVVCLSFVFLPSCESVDHKATKFLSYEFIRNHYLFHHVVYNGNDYYQCDDTEPGEKSPDPDAEVEVILVDEDGEAYKKGVTEKAWLFHDDENETYMYIYYISVTCKKA